MQALINRVDKCLAQTQCQRCGYDSCAEYAKAIVEDQVAINRCPPGGEQTLDSLANLLQLTATALDPDCGEFSGFRLALIDEQWCIGCTICIQKCPVDAIVGASKRMHTVVTEFCSGCELCVEPCPTSCISMVVPSEHPSWDGKTSEWTDAQQGKAKRRFMKHQARLKQEQTMSKDAKHRRRLRRANHTDKKTAIAAALARVGSHRLQE